MHILNRMGIFKMTEVSHNEWMDMVENLNRILKKKINSTIHTGMN